MIRNRAKGGTLVLWRSYLDPYISVHKPESSAFLPIILNLPDTTTTIHVALYLPTAGKDAEYMAELAKLKVSLEELNQQFPHSIIFLRGDANSSKSNPRRNSIFQSFCNDLNLVRVDVGHNTYHHFTGNGSHDSELDVLLYSNHVSVEEQLIDLHCQLHDPRIDSHHDLLLSSCTFPSLPSILTKKDKSENVTAPRVDNKRHKIIWSEDGIALFEQITSSLLPELRLRWQTPSQSATSVLLQSTNFHAASVSNKVVPLSSIRKSKSERTPKIIRKSCNALSKCHSELRSLILDPSSSEESISLARMKLIVKKRDHRKLC